MYSFDSLFFCLFILFSLFPFFSISLFLSFFHYSSLFISRSLFSHLLSFFLSSLLSPQKRPVPSDPQDSEALKRPGLVDARLTDARLAEARLAEARLAETRLAEARLAEARLAETRLAETRLAPDVTSTTTMTKIKGGHGQTSPVTNPSFHTKTEIQATTAQSQVGAPQNGFPLAHKLFGSPLELEARNEGPTAPMGHQGGGPDAGKHQPLANNQHKKKKSKKHKDKERERLKDKQERPWTESSPEHKQSRDKLHGKGPQSLRDPSAQSRGTGFKICSIV